MPRTERTYHRAENWAFKNVPGVQKLMRATVYGLNEGHRVPRTHLLPQALKPVELVCRGNIAKSIKDPELREKVTPKFAVGCKRIPRSNNWYPAIARPECRPGHRRHPARSPAAAW